MFPLWTLLNYQMMLCASLPVAFAWDSACAALCIQAHCILQNSALIPRWLVLSRYCQADHTTSLRRQAFLSFLAL